MKAHHHEETLRHLYYDRGLGQINIGKKLNISRRSIEYWMGKHDIETRKPDWKKPGCFTFNKGYAKFTTRDGGDRHTIQIHRLVKAAYDKDFNFFDKNEIVHHKNGIKWDNRPSNLEVMGRAEHTSHHRS